MKKLALLALLISPFASGETPGGACPNFLLSTLSAFKKEDYSKSFSRQSLDVSTRYDHDFRVLEFEGHRANIVSRNSKSYAFKEMMNSTAAKNYLDNPNVEVITYNVFNPKTHSTQMIYALKPPRLSSNENIQSVLFKNYLNEVSEVYSSRLQFSEKKLAEIKGISQSMSERSVVFTVLDESAHRRFQGGIIAVFSNKTSDLLPMEAMIGKKVIRDENELVVELGRLILLDEKVANEQETMAYLVSTVSTLLKSKPNLSRVLINPAGPVQERMYLRYGFKRIQQAETGMHDFSKDMLMEVSPAELMSKALSFLK